MSKLTVSQIKDALLEVEDESHGVLDTSKDGVKVSKKCLNNAAKAPTKSTNHVSTTKKTYT